MSPTGAYLIETIVTLLAVLALAFVMLYGSRRLGIGRTNGPLELVGRLPIDARRAVYLVRVGKLVYVVGASEGGLQKLGEMGAESLGTGDSAPETAPKFSELFARLGQGARSRRREPAEIATHEEPHA